MHIKITIRYHFIPIRMVTIKKKKKKKERREGKREEERKEELMARSNCYTAGRNIV